MSAVMARVLSPPGGGRNPSDHAGHKDRLAATFPVDRVQSFGPDDLTGHTPWSEVKAARHRLTEQERRERATTGAQLQAQIAELATLLGWSYLHLRPAQTKHGWRTPVEGPLGAGWPDLFLIRIRDRRLLAIEVKRQLEHPTAEQVAVLAGLEQCGISAFVARPSDLRDPIEDSVVGRWLR